MKVLHICLALCLSVASVAADDRRGLLLGERDVAPLLDIQCETQLPLCKEGPGGSNLASRTWLLYLNSFNDDSIMFDLAEIAADDVDFSPIANFTVTQSDAGIAGSLIRTLLRLTNLDENVQDLDRRINLLAEYAQLINLIAERRFNISLRPIVKIIQLVIGFYLALQGGPVTLTIFIVQRLARWLISFLTNAMFLIMGSSVVDKECTAELMTCQYNALIATTFPVLFGQALLMSTLRPPSP